MLRKRSFWCCLASIISLYVLALFTLLNKEDVLLRSDYVRPQAKPQRIRIHVREDYPIPCTDSPPRLLCIVHSAPTHFVHRKTIRRTWGSALKCIKTVFAVGRSVVGRVQDRIEREFVQHRDLLMLDFVDSYRNLSLKHVAAGRWAISTTCADSSTIVLKTDDDAFVDVIRLVPLIRHTFGRHVGDLLACQLVPVGSAPKRSGKWAVTQEEYSMDGYPEYCSGLAYIASVQTLSKIALASETTPYLWIDDVYWTGMSANAAMVTRSDFSVWFADKEKLVLDWLKEPSERSCPWMFAELSPSLYPDTALALWNKTFHSHKSQLTDIC